jgi:hypothetical protein
MTVSSSIGESPTTPLQNWTCAFDKPSRTTYGSLARCYITPPNVQSQDSRGGANPDRIKTRLLSWFRVEVGPQVRKSRVFNRDVNCRLPITQSYASPCSIPLLESDQATRGSAYACSSSSILLIRRSRVRAMPTMAGFPPERIFILSYFWRITWSFLIGVQEAFNRRDLRVFSYVQSQGSRGAAIFC